MRPRRIRRGEREKAIAGEQQPPGASMRPRRIRSGERRNHRPICKTKSASMRPRRIRRGEPALPTFPDCTAPASMRPRRIRRGEPDAIKFIMESKGSFNAATANSPWRTKETEREKDVEYRLQCGHGEFA